MKKITYLLLALVIISCSSINNSKNSSTSRSTSRSTKQSRSTGFKFVDFAGFKTSRLIRLQNGKKIISYKFQVSNYRKDNSDVFQKVLKNLSNKYGDPIIKKTDSVNVKFVSAEWKRNFANFTLFLMNKNYLFLIFKYN